MWIESHQSLLRHRKTIDAVALLDCNRFQLIGHLHALWWWCLDNAPNGQSLTGYQVAAGAEWDGDRSDFVTALATAGFLDPQLDGRYCVHDWYEFAGKLIERRDANAERMREKRAAHVQRTDIARAPATVPNLTVPNQVGSNGSLEGSSPARKATGPPPPTTDEKTLLDILSDTADYPFDVKEDLKLVRRTLKVYPLEIVRSTWTGWALKWEGQSPGARTRGFRAQLFNWCAFEKPGVQNGATGPDYNDGARYFDRNGDDG